MTPLTTDDHHPAQKKRTLWLTGTLHAFTHLYNVALLPLYLMIQKDFGLESVGGATLLVTVMMLSYFVPSYPMGILADRIQRKQLLGWGLAINALGFISLSFAPTYGWALASVVMAGLGGSFYHPAASAMVARIYPLNTGKAFGIVGIGASVGFFIAPIYAGWRAEASGWRAPVLELGLMGILAAILFFWLAEDEPAAQPEHSPHQPQSQTMFPTPLLWFLFLGACVAFGLRDFAGSSMGSLGSLFLQRAHDFTPKHTGLALSAIFLSSAISNPLFGGLSDRGRVRWTSLVLCIAMVLVAVFPHLPQHALIPVYVVYGFFFMASYPMIEAALMQSVPDQVRGRVMGLFITFGGFLGNISHWMVGRWVQNLGDAAEAPSGYYGLYAALGALLLISLLGLPCLHAIRKREHMTAPAAGSEPPPGKRQLV